MDKDNLTDNGPDRASILIVDDDPANVESLTRVLEHEGYRVRGASSGAEALEKLRAAPADVVIVDLMMPGMSGLELMKACRHISPDSLVIMITAYGAVDIAVKAMKEGAHDFITKPVKRMTVVKAVRQALEKRELVIENRELRARLVSDSKQPIVGASEAIRKMMATIAQAAPARATVLLIGESGSGKELAARALHAMSARPEGPFVAINCGALPEGILEAELFGYEKGAFTGAISRREGLFERASGGTLFLDEVGELSPNVQVRLLRALQEGEITRLGGREPIQVDVRVIAATHRDLAADVRSGRFREDLFYRLNVIQIRTPPLRERGEDIPLLVDHFIIRHCARNQRPRKGIDQDAMAALQRYSWPGNVRELENTIERAVVLGVSPNITLADLPENIASAPVTTDGYLRIKPGTPLAEVERMLIHETLRLTQGDKSLAAHLLGITSRTIYRKLESEREPPEGE
ncbi:MAG: Transcriptional regulatory protein ZraR [Myxococcota bacterium]|nr:Transcriptional regulatory protein ZraR [Myxococcota bacterium]